MKPEDYNTQNKPVWCPGCGNFGILMAVKQAFAKADLKKKETVVVNGIGCSDKYHQYIDTYGFESIHGRILPVAMGLRLANHKLKVVCIGGDGDGYGIGMCHFIHAMRRNLDVTYIVCNNQIYGLTTGQTSPTSEKGFETKSTPNGNIEPPVNPIALALASGATFIARGFAGEVPYLRDLIIEGLNHKGFSLIDVFQPCVTFNHKNTYEWFNDKLYKLEDHDPKDRDAAVAKASETDKLPIGIFYREEKPTYEDEIEQISRKPLVEQDISGVKMDDLLDELS
ncbi:2-oxoacid ferredoxin oxidoreductase [Candidatus Woesearchaeota archaeon]|nr:2-oxoacid ferredoxin oxidoreductase [Candidatus Woesearchaeota archaeon]